MELFDIIKSLFSKDNTYSEVTNHEKKKNIFMVNRRIAINYPLQVQALQHIRINEVAVMDFWRLFMNKQYNYTPPWMYTKGSKKVKEENEKKLNIKEESIIKYASYYNLDLKSVREAIELYPNEMKKEITELEKLNN